MGPFIVRVQLWVRQRYAIIATVSKEDRNVFNQNALCQQKAVNQFWLTLHVAQFDTIARKKKFWKPHTTPNTTGDAMVMVTSIIFEWHQECKEVEVGVNSSFSINLIGITCKMVRIFNQSYFQAVWLIPHSIQKDTNCQPIKRIRVKFVFALVAVKDVLQKNALQW